MLDSYQLRTDINFQIHTAEMEIKTKYHKQSIEISLLRLNGCNEVLRASSFCERHNLNSNFQILAVRAEPEERDKKRLTDKEI